MINFCTPNWKFENHTDLYNQYHSGFYTVMICTSKMYFVIYYVRIYPFIVLVVL